MAAHRRGIALTPMETRREVIVEMAVLADSLGYELFAVPEGWGFDSTLVLTEIAGKTKQITLMAGILSVWGRTAGTIAMNAATLADISGGRYVLGLGASTKALVEGFHGVPFEGSITQLRETTESVQQILAGERAPLPPEIETRALKMGQSPQPDLPIYLAGMGQRSVEVAAEVGDGWFPYLVARERFASWVPELLQMRAAAGKGDVPFTIVAGPNISVQDDTAVARQVCADNLAWYTSAMGDAYANSLTRQGYGEAVEAIRAANPKPSPSRGVIPAEAENLLRQVAVFGAAETVANDLMAWDEAVDITTVGIPPGLSWPEITAILYAAAPRH